MLRGMKLIALFLTLLFALSAPVRAGDIASYYGFESGTFTASGERFNPRAMTCAHRTLPFGTRLRVTFRGRSVVVRVNDRGPAKWTHRSIDLSIGAARAIGLITAGVGAVKVERF